MDPAPGQNLESASAPPAAEPTPQRRRRRRKRNSGREMERRMRKYKKLIATALYVIVGTALAVAAAVYSGRAL